MKRAMVWASMLAVCLLFGAPAQAMTADEAELSALYNAIFAAEEPVDEEPVDVDGDGDIDDEDLAAGGNILCCASHGSCVRTSTRDRCIGEPYNGVVCNDVPDCRRKGCTC